MLCHVNISRSERASGLAKIKINELQNYVHAWESTINRKLPKLSNIRLDKLIEKKYDKL